MNYKIKEIIRGFLRYNPFYRTVYSEISSDIDVVKSLNLQLKYIHENIPYYKKLSIMHSDYDSFPLIRKKDILGKEHLFVSEKCCKKLLKIVETGGSTGFSLSLYRSVKDIIVETAFADYLFSLVGDNLNIAVLRGQRPSSGICEVISKNRIVLSSYSLLPELLDSYIDLLNKYQISCLHVYPSSLLILSRLIKDKYGKIELPYLKGILSSSEIFSRDDKRLVKDVFPNVKIIDYYGHNEQSCCAISVDDGFFKFNARMGYVEFLETGEFINGNRIAEIVSTSLLNKTMPFARYGTEDYVELDNNNNVVSIIGRTSDFIVDKNMNILPCIVLTRDRSFKNVINFQYHQDTIGVLNFRVVVNASFSDVDIKFLEEDLFNSFGSRVSSHICVVESLERTISGKQKRLVQELDTNKIN